MSRSLRKKPRISYYEPEEPNLDEYIFCSDCKDYVYEYCSIHGALLVIPDDVVPAITNFPSYVPRSALTIPHVFLHLAYSNIPDAGLGVFSTLTLPSGVRFGPYRGERTQDIGSNYCWQIYDSNRKPSHVIDACDPNKSNWMRFVNCSRHWHEQNLLAFQYQGEIYYKTLNIIPRHTELLVYYGSEFANKLGIDIRRYNAPKLFHLKMGAPVTICDDSDDTNNNRIKAMEDVPRVEAPNEVGEKNTKVDDTAATECISKQPTTNETKANFPNKDKAVNKTKSVFKIPEQKKSVSLSFLCDHCQQKFCTKMKLQEHISTHYRIAKVNLTCQTCDYEGDTVQALEKHSRLHDEKRRFKCNTCTYRFNSNHELKQHVKVHTGEKRYKCDFCDYASSFSSALKRHMRIHTGETHKCDFCDYASNESGNLKRHMRIHTGETHKCDFCYYASNESGNLKRHMRIHTGEKPYKCNLCDYASSFSTNLKNHIRKDTGETHKCDFCDYASSFSSALKRHMRIHTGEKPYKCNLCDYASSFSNNLKNHIRKHTGETHKCDFCDYASSFSSDLKRHMRIHTGEKPYKCNLCDYASSFSTDLKNHIRKHTGETHKCDFCDYASSFSSALKRHMRIHTGEKPYKCDLCEFRCSENGNLNRHKQQLHAASSAT